MPSRGSEEFYRYRPMSPGGYSYNNQTLDLLRGSTDRLVDQQRQIGESRAEAARQRSEDLGNAVGSIYMGYRQGQADKRENQRSEREAKRFDTEEAAARQAAELNQLSMAETKSRMEDAQHQRDFMRNPLASGKSREEEQYSQGIQSQNLNQQMAQAQIAALARQGKNETQDRKLAEVTQLMQAAVASGDPAQKAQVEAYARTQGLQPQDVQRAVLAANTNISQAGASKDLVYASSPEGQLATERLVDVNRDVDAFNQFNEAAREYKESAMFGMTDKGERAVAKMQRALVAMGEDPGMVDRAWYGGREGKIEDAIGAIQNQIRQKLALAQTGAGSAGPGLKASFQNTSNLVNQVAPQAQKKQDFRSAWDAAGAGPNAGRPKSQMIEFLKGGR